MSHIRTLFFALVCGVYLQKNSVSKVIPLKGYHNQLGVVGGNVSAPYRWPWILRLQFDGAPFVSCGASLISVDIALTAGHCVPRDTPLDTILVIAGDFSKANRDTFERSLTIRKVVRTGQTEDEMGDIAILFLNEKISPCTLQVGTIRLPYYPSYEWGYSEVDEYEDCYAIGWGSQSETAVLGNQSDKLLEVRLSPPLSSAQCQQVAGVKLPSDIVCSATPLKDTGDGDSGGPYFCRRHADKRWTLVGITIAGVPHEESRPAYIGVYTSVKWHLNWIMEQIMMEPKNTFWTSYVMCSRYWK